RGRCAHALDLHVGRGGEHLLGALVLRAALRGGQRLGRGQLGEVRAYDVDPAGGHGHVSLCVVGLWSSDRVSALTTARDSAPPARDSQGAIRRLGWSGRGRMTRMPTPSVPDLLYGTAWKEERTQGLVELALRTGFRGIDTANQRRHYFEAAVGLGLAAAYREGVGTRDDLFLQTKYTYLAGQDHRLPHGPQAHLPRS